MKRDPYAARQNRVLIGSAPRFGAQVYQLPEDIPLTRWFTWRLHWALVERQRHLPTTRR